MKHSPSLLFLILFGALTGILPAQERDTLVIRELPTITVTATRISSELTKLPQSISTYEAGEVQNLRQQLSLQEYLNNMPGVFTQNANNFAQDLRISVRGFGARSAFGIRGIRLLVDGIPETTPDGQGQLDNLNLGIVSRIEVIRGASSSLYGNSSGGVISIQTLKEVDSTFVEVAGMAGSFNFQQYQVLAGVQLGDKSRFIAQGSRTSTDGYRDQSGVETYNFNGRWVHDFSENTQLNLMVNYMNSPWAEDPGALDSASVAANRQQARDRNVLFDAGEEIAQLRLSGTFSHKWGKGHTVNAYAFHTTRDFLGRLPFEFGGWVELSRQFYGQGASYTWETPLFGAMNKLQVGYDVAHQQDDRTRFLNQEGSKGSLTLNQQESFTNLGAYVVNQLAWENLSVMVGVRYDGNQIGLKDNFLENGDDSDREQLTSFMPSLGIVHDFTPGHQVFANFQTSFETPSLSELSANPEGQDGFNATLEPQLAQSIEMGVRGKLGQKFRYALTFFYIETTNDLVPYELAAFPDRTFFRNAGSTIRQGIEIEAHYLLMPGLQLTGTYSFSGFVYEAFETLGNNWEGNTLPGIPRHMAAVNLQYQSTNGLLTQIQTRYAGEIFTNDANTVTYPGYFLLNAQVGYKWQKKGWTVQPFLGVNNLLDQKYTDNIRINAFGGRYFEPGPGIHFFGGVRVRPGW
ncbi:MAG: TonB-dependent receptor [Bacteroidota bacterium]